MNSLSRNLEPWESDRELDPAMVRMMAEAFLPDLPQYEIQYVGSGWCNDVYNLNSEWILRFPRRRDVLSNLKKEAGVSAFLIPLLKETGVPIPDFSIISPPIDCGFPYSFGAYPMIPGVSGGTRIRPVTDWSKFAKSLGNFLTTLHSIPTTNTRDLDVHERRPLECLQWLDQKADVTRFINSLKDEALSRNAQWFESKPPEPYSGRLRFTHDDLSPEHILINPDDGAITGIIDWEDATIGDPVSDFITLPFWIGWDNTQRVLDHYRLEIDKGFQERLEYASRISSLVWLYDESKRNDDVSLQKWYVSNVFNKRVG